MWSCLQSGQLSDWWRCSSLTPLPVYWLPYLWACGLWPGCPSSCSSSCEWRRLLRLDMWSCVANQSKEGRILPAPAKGRETNSLYWAILYSSTCKAFVSLILGVNWEMEPKRRHYHMRWFNWMVRARCTQQDWRTISVPDDVVNTMGCNRGSPIWLTTCSLSFFF